MRLLNAVVFFAGCIVATSATPSFSASGVIDRACRKSDREAATPALCSCIQKVANRELSRSDRRRVAKFFDDPHLAQEMRQSDNRSDEKLWLRYKEFGETARAACS